MFNRVFVMDIASLLCDSSRYTIELVSKKVITDPVFIKATLDLSLAERGQTSQRAARVICVCAERDHQTVKPHLFAILKVLQTSNDDSILMNFMKIFTSVPLPRHNDLLGILADCCFLFIESSSAKVGLKVYSLETLYRICCIEPGLKNEMICLVENQMERNDSAFRARGERVMALLKKSDN